MIPCVGLEPGLELLLMKVKLEALALPVKRAVTRLLVATVPTEGMVRSAYHVWDSHLAVVFMPLAAFLVGTPQPRIRALAGMVTSTPEIGTHL